MSHCPKKPNKNDRLGPQNDLSKSLFFKSEGVHFDQLNRFRKVAVAIKTEVFSTNIEKLSSVLKYQTISKEVTSETWKTFTQQKFLKI